MTGHGTAVSRSATTAAREPARRPSRWLIAAAAYLAALSASLPLYGYRWHLSLHVIGAHVFVGTVTGMAIWMIAAVASRRDLAIRRAARAVAAADIWLTAPAVILVLGNGFAMVVASSSTIEVLWASSWIALGFGAMLITGAIWFAVLIPVQRRMLRAARSSAALPRSFFNDVRRWTVYGVAATALPWTAYLLMTTRPAWW